MPALEERRRGCKPIALPWLALWVMLSWLGASLASAGPFSGRIGFTQPDGTQIVIWGEGNDFYAHLETLEGYTVVFVPETRAYYYARLSADGQELLPTTMQVGQGDPQALGLASHLRIPPEAARRQASLKYQEWDRAVQESERWSALKRARREAEAGKQGALGMSLSAMAAATAVTNVGLCLLVDFQDQPGTISRDEIINFCNADFYESYGNNGSVKKYFQDNSGGLLTYQNVVTPYIRIPNSVHPRSYYNDTSKSCFVQANWLIRDAIAVMRALPNYASEILPTFAPLSVGPSNRVIALNVFFAGENSGAWAYGLWPNSGGLTNVGPLELSPGGKTVWRYQMTPMSTSLEIGLFCHENGHMLFGYPDIYDYDFDAVGGAGLFCLMNNGWRGPNPTQISAYLKYVAGWARITEINRWSDLQGALTATAGPEFNHFYRYLRPGVPTEYFIVENRQQTGRDANLPSSGIAIWHIDELGDRDNQNLSPNTTHANYEVTLVPADNRWDFQHNVNDGDATDLFYENNSAPGYPNRFSAATSPAAKWWDGTDSGAIFRNFSYAGATMTFHIGTPVSLRVQRPANNTLTMVLTGEPGLPYQIDMSSDLTSWTYYTTVTSAAGGQATFTYPNLSASQARFFRATPPP